MSHGFMHYFSHAIGHQAHEMRKKGQSGKANALLLFCLSFVLMPVPFIGIPMLICSLFKLFSSDEK